MGLPGIGPGPPLPRAHLWLLPCLLAVPMLLVAELAGRRDLIVPPLLAVAFGVWVMHRPDWVVSRWRILLLPVFAAATGLAATRLPGPRWLVLVGVLTVVLALLQATRCRIGPALAVGLLPVVFDIRSLAYLAAVAVLAAAVALTCGSVGPVAIVAWPWRRVGVFWLVVVGWTAVGLGVLALTPVVVAPSVLVAVLDFTLVGGAARAGLRRCVLLVGAAAAGGASMAFIPAVTVAGTAAVAAVVLLAAALAEPLAPALAVALVPFVAGVEAPLRIAVGLATGAVLLHGAIWVGLVAVPLLSRYLRY